MKYQLTEDFPEHIFRAYDIRSDSSILTEQRVYTLAVAFAHHLKNEGVSQCLVGYDGRLSSPSIVSVLMEGLQDMGIQVFNLGMIPTPLLYFAAATGSVTSGIMVTASHNPPQDNGFKMLVKNHSPTEAVIHALYDSIQEGTILKKQLHASTRSTMTHQDIIPAYEGYIEKNIHLSKSLRVVVDCSNGVSGLVAPHLLKALGCEVTVLNGEVDGGFPHHKPDTSVPSAYEQLQQTVVDTKAELGILFDGDADRVGMVSEDGTIIWPDRLLMLLIMDILKRYPGAPIVYDVKSTQDLKPLIESYGGIPILWRTGHSFMKRKVYETKAPVGGELSGHIFFNDGWFGFDDGIYAAIRLLEVISTYSESLKEKLETLPQRVSTPEILYPIQEEEKFSVIQELQKKTFPGSVEVCLIDGVRVSFPGGWALIRASNTSPNLTLRFEANTPHELKEIQTLMEGILKTC